ncbi:trihelix transcription factor ASR3 [Asparagus officinalis]|uniref:trihelix transcription factor ASR3 n=1 Tax=Asparagus officinalis TaxID=4686 RepID=UPI00098E2179|nr:trihelix transcription factor ASR3 [Asparagus officinalis]
MSSPIKSSGRLPRWSRQEILALVEAKQAYEGQRRWGPVRPTEPKWAFISSHCRNHGGVERGPLQCRKRWSNLACDFKKIRGKEEGYWRMRSGERRERRLPGFFDREVFERMREVKGEMHERLGKDQQSSTADNSSVVDERKYQPENYAHSDTGNSNDNQQADNNPEKGQKRRRTSEAAEEEEQETSFDKKLIKILEKSTKLLAANLEARNLNCQLDRDQRKDQTESLLAVMTKLADAVGRIADKL